MPYRLKEKARECANRFHRKQRAERRAAGLCRHCGKTLPCKHPRTYVEVRRAAGLCIQCGGPRPCSCMAKYYRATAAKRKAVGLCVACGGPRPCNCGRPHTPNARYGLLRYVARSRELAMELTKGEYIELISNPCHWCGGPLDESGTQIDRLDSSLGYLKGNVVPCCGWCNVMKTDMPVDEFLSRVRNIYERHVRL